MVVADFQNAGHLPALAAASKVVPVALVEEVFSELTIASPDAKQRQRDRARQAQTELAAGDFEVFEIHPGTREQEMFSLLRGARTSQHDRGEAASIAMASAHADLLFVTGDKNGTLSALNELSGTGERVMRVPVFVKVLFTAGALSVSDARAVAPFAASHGITPIWWDDWLRSL